MKNEVLQKIIRYYGLRNTPIRLDMLNLFINANKALSSKTLIKKLGNKYNRVSIFRTIKSFVEKGIIHSIPIAKDYVVYSICRNNCREGNHLDQHYHFYCNICEHTYCMNDFYFDQGILPAGYNTERINILLEGVCKKCSKN